MTHVARGLQSSQDKECGWRRALRMVPPALIPCQGQLRQPFPRLEAGSSKLKNESLINDVNFLPENGPQNQKSF